MPKRVLNVLVGSALLAVLAPLLALIAVFIKVLGGPGPVLRREQRFNATGTPYRAWQFRVQPQPRMSNEPAWHSEDRRLAPVGAWLSRYHLDELPKLMNVISGDVDFWAFSGPERAGEQ